MIKNALKLFGDARLRTKLILSYMVVVIMPMLLFGYFFMDRTKDAVIKQTDNINQISFDQMKNNIYNQLQTYLTFSNNAINQDSLIQYMATKLSDEYTEMDRFLEYSRFKEKFLLKFGNNKDSAKVEFYTSNNSILQDNNNVFYIDENIKKNVWYEDAIAAFGGNAINLSSNPEGQYLITISRLVRSTNSNKFIIVLKIDIPEEYLFNLIKNEGKNKRIYLIDDKNKIITSTDRKSIGKNISQVNTFNGIELKKYPQRQKLNKVIDDENYEININHYNDKSSIDNWKIVSMVSSELLTRTFNDIASYGLIVCGISIFITIIFVLLFSNTLTKRLRKLARNMGKIRDGKFEVLVDSDSKDEIGELTSGFKLMIHRINSLIEEVYKSEVRVKDLIIKKKESEIRALQSQINPHFLFNTMESIRMNLLKKQDRETANIVQSFAKLLRKSIDWSNEIMTLKQELDLVETYLIIQKYRYRDKLDYIFKIDESLYEYPIIKFSLQPLVENSIFHGIEMKEDNGVVIISAEKQEYGVKITIRDDGVGITEEKLKKLRQRLASGVQNQDGASIGIINVDQRIKLFYGEEYGININSSFGLGTCTEITLPSK